MGEKIPVIVFKNKSKHGRYLAALMDVGDWNDKDLDVSIDDIENAFMIWRNDLSVPDVSDVDNLKKQSVLSMLRSGCNFMSQYIWRLQMISIGMHEN